MSSKYTFFKPLDISKKKKKTNKQTNKTLINANILIRISLIIPHLLYFISISKSKKKKKKKKKVLYLTINLCFSLYLFLLYRCSTSMDRLPAEEGKKINK